MIEELSPMQIFPGKPLTVEQAIHYISDGMEVAWAGNGPKRNYKNRENLDGLPNIVVYLCCAQQYYLMTPEEFLSNNVQKQLELEQQDYYGELVSQERVGS